VLVVLMLIGMVLETAGVGLVIPVLGLITVPDFDTRYRFIASVLRVLGNPNHTTQVVWAMASLVAFYAIKALFLSFLAWRQMTFVFGLQADLSQRLFAGYLRQPYTFHLQRNSAQLIRNVIGQVGDITTVTLGAMLLVTEGQVLLGIAVLLLAIEPVGALLVAVSMGAAGWTFHRLTRARILRWGEARQVHEEMRILHLQHGLGGAKDVKLLGRESDFLAEYWRHNEGTARVGRHQATLQQLPRLAMEFLAVTGLAALVMVMIARGSSLQVLLPTIGVFAAAAFRMMPSVNRVLGGLQALKYAEPAINSIFAEFDGLQDSPVKRATPLSLRHALALENVVYRYPGTESAALQGVSLTVPCGSSVGFIGRSGAGKSTLVDVLLGLLTPVSGAVRVDGVDIQTNLRGWQDQIGYVPQTIFLTDDSFRRNVAFGLPADRIDEAAVWRAIRAAQLDQFIEELPHGLDTVVGERGVRLSGGQRQRIGIARALYHDPPVIVLDEATSSLDTGTESGVMDAVRALHGNKTVLIIAHRASTVAHCDRLFRLELGRLVEQAAPVPALGAPTA
jgi:ABC-type multidrug transport system fused ATPase/permease subunit